jgi:hypothetical protein
MSHSFPQKERKKKSNNFCQIAEERKVKKKGTRKQKQLTVRRSLGSDGET